MALYFILPMVLLSKTTKKYLFTYNSLFSYERVSLLRSAERIRWREGETALV